MFPTADADKPKYIGVDAQLLSKQSGPRHK